PLRYSLPFPTRRSSDLPCQTHQEFAQAYLKFALSRPREYEVINSGLLARLDDRPNFDFAARRSADWLGGTPAENRRLIFAIAALDRKSTRLNSSHRTIS